MSEVARLWSRNIRGVNISEHAVLRELGEYAHAETDLCFPKIDTIAGIYECERRCVERILTRLEVWRFLERIETFESNARQTSNRYRLNFRQHFPAPRSEGRTTRNKNKKAPVAPYDDRDNEAFRGSAIGALCVTTARQFFAGDETLGAGIKESFLQRPMGHRKGKAILWLGLESESVEDRVIKALPELAQDLRKTAQDPTCEISLLALFSRNPTKSKKQTA